MKNILDERERPFKKRVPWEVYIPGIICFIICALISSGINADELSLNRVLYFIQNNPAESLAYLVVNISSFLIGKTFQQNKY